MNPIVSSKFTLQPDGKSTYREVVFRVSNKRSWLDTADFFVILFMRADFPTFVYPTKAMMGM